MHVNTQLKLSEKWSKVAIAELFDAKFFDLLYRAHTVHRENQPHNQIQLAKLLSIKTGACPENCKYCSQSGHHKTNIEREKLLPLEVVINKAKAAKAAGATRFCMGGAWKSPPLKIMPELVAMIKAVQDLGLETCATFGNLNSEQVTMLKDAGLDYYNHNINTSPEHHDNIVTTHSFQDRIDTVNNVRAAGIKVCCGGIMGMGESREDRVSFIYELANMPTPPESVPINQLIPVAGTPLAEAKPLDNFEFIRTIAVARITMPKSVVRLSAGRVNMSEEMQTLCFFAGANSIFHGDKLLTEADRSANENIQLFAKLGLSTSNA